MNAIPPSLCPMAKPGINSITMNASATPQSKNKAIGLVALVIVAFVALGGIFMFIHRARSAPNPIEQRLHAEQEIHALKKQAQAIVSR